MSNTEEANRKPSKGAKTMRSIKETSTNAIKTIKRYRKPAYLNTMSEAEKDANLKVLDNMNKRVNYLKNPRYKTNKAPILMSTVYFDNLIITVDGLQ